MRNRIDRINYWFMLIKILCRRTVLFYFITLISIDSFSFDVLAHLLFIQLIVATSRPKPTKATDLLFRLVTVGIHPLSQT